MKAVGNKIYFSVFGFIY